MIEFWKTMGGKVFESAFGSLAPAFLFWLAGLGTWVTHTGVSKPALLYDRLSHQPEVFQISIVADVSGNDQEKEMDNQNALFGWMFIMGLILLILAAIAGGLFRTEVTYISPGIANAGDSIPFQEDLNAKHWLFGLIKGQQPDLQKAMAKYVRPGEQVAKLTIITKHSWLDNFIVGITFFIYCPQTVTIKGSIARKQEQTSRAAFSHFAAAHE